ncbi:MAG: hypothetical protein ACRELF_25995, partial [Gemmataceae bacterium]
MHGMASAGVAAILMLGLGATGAMGQGPLTSGQKSLPPGLLSGLFEGKAKQANTTDNNIDKSTAQQAIGSVATSASRRSGYEKVFLRRSAV